MSRTTQHLRRVLLPCAALAVLAALSASAAAQVTSAQQSAIRSNCRSDFQSKCSGVTPGGKDALNCLQSNVASLSGGCQAAVRATMPAVAAPAAAPPPPPPAAATAEPAPAAKPATITSAAPPKAQTAKKSVQKPAAATAAVAPPAPPPAAPPAAAQAQPAMVPGDMLVEKACARFILMHCASAGMGNGPKVACMAKFVNEGNFVGPRCLAALKVTGQLR